MENQQQNSSQNPSVMSEQSVADERIQHISKWKRILASPELGAVSGTVLIFVFFLMVAGDTGMFAADGIMSWLSVAAYLGVIAVGAGLLMIGGEFDLSIGSMIGMAGMLVAVPVAFYGWSVWVSIVFSFVVCMAIGAINGWLVVKTKLPSFIISLAFLYILRGLTIAGAIFFTNRTIVGGISDQIEADWLAGLFNSVLFKGVFIQLAKWHVIDSFKDGSPIVEGIPIIIVWWFGLTALGTWVLLRTKYGNWIFASGGDQNAASNVGVPVQRVKICLFIFAAFSATVYGISQVMEFGSAAADRGLLKEFEAIIAVVIGGTLLTGGYGSVIGAAFGALIFGVVQMGILYTGAPSDWFRVFLGIMLLGAVILNTYIRKNLAGR